ncbi:MAG: transketolase [Oligoflexia bacterium]|nr:transketolase [Oligoflexia bacterium]
MNNDLRLKIVEMIRTAGEGHIPSAFSIIDIIAHLYDHVLKVDPSKPDWDERDYFILSKGHGCAALYVVLEKHGFITQHDLNTKSKPGGILGGHPDRTKVPGAEASTGSLGHGAVTAMGLALGLRIRGKRNRVFALLGDGECNEGTIWETALVASNLKLGNLCFVVDENGSAAQVLPMTDLSRKWEAFGWEAQDINGHDGKELAAAFEDLSFNFTGKPKVIVAHTLKGKGVGFLEGHGAWHYKIPNDTEYAAIRKELGQ